MLVKLFAPPDAHSLEIAGVRDAFFEANQQMGPADHYDLRILCRAPGPLVCASGIRLIPDGSIAEETEQADTLIVAGAYGVPAQPEPEVIDWLRDQAGGARRYGSICTGAFQLAAAGLLDGRRVTTHWQYAGRLASEHPEVTVEPDRIVLRDGPVFTSAGVAAALDLALALIEEDHGRALALWVARRLVVFLKRPGGQSQFSPAQPVIPPASSAVERVRQHVLDNPASKLSVAALASVAGMSLRNFSRSFRAETGMSPAIFVELTRVSVARRLLEETQLSVKTVVFTAGFGSAAAARRAFLRRLGLAPAEYRRRFRTSLAETGNLAENED